MLWWIGWLVSNGLGRIAFPSLDPDASLAELRSDSVNYMIADGFDVAVLALAIVVIRVLTKRQEAKADAQAEQVPEQAAPIASPQPA